MKLQGERPKATQINKIDFDIELGNPIEVDGKTLIPVLCKGLKPSAPKTEVEMVEGETTITLSEEVSSNPIRPGDGIKANGLATGTKVVSISSDKITLNKPATASDTTTATIYPGTIDATIGILQADFSINGMQLTGKFSLAQMDGCQVCNADNGRDRATVKDAVKTIGLGEFGHNLEPFMNNARVPRKD